MEFKDYWERRANKFESDPRSIMHHPEDSEKQIKDLKGFFTDVELNFELDIRSVTDYGCGIGRMSNILTSLFANYIGVDISKKMVSEARKNHPELLYKTISEYSQIQKGDLLFFYTVLLHVPPEEIEIFSSAIKGKFKYIFIAEHMDEYATKRYNTGFDKVKRTHCFNRPVEYYQKVFGVKRVINIKTYPTIYKDTKITYFLGEL